ncbi:hypothetical protein M0813_19542 [Anaeramoeba flamelloides]|uniref:BTB domain-containing protein n=1 Tax=Anaeramoeba flamelloides TaxID=1746091 RepID=A0ABQ8YNK6_9EUKA|nr:hypothetical protein M0813_19542 [Anaeramoeba flamelloides]
MDCYLSKHLQTFNEDFKNFYEFQENTDMIIKEIKVHSIMIKIRLGIDATDVKLLLEDYSKEVVKYFLNWLYFDENKHLSVLRVIFKRFKINNPGKKTVRNDISNYYHVDKDYDFDLIVEEKKIPCHKFILQARSNVFRGFFTSINEKVTSLQDLSGKSYNTMKLFIKFLYLDKIDTSEIPTKNLTDLKELGEYYQLNENSPLIFSINLDIERKSNEAHEAITNLNCTRVNDKTILTQTKETNALVNFFSKRIYPFPVNTSYLF